MTELNYLQESDVVAVYRTNDKLVNRSRTGYGGKIPMQYKIKLSNNKTYRMYCMIYSNSGTCYIVKNGVQYLTSRVEYSDKFQNPIVMDDVKRSAQ